MDSLKINPAFWTKPCPPDCWHKSERSSFSQSKVHFSQRSFPNCVYIWDLRLQDYRTGVPQPHSPILNVHQSRCRNNLLFSTMTCLLRCFGSRPPCPVASPPGWSWAAAAMVRTHPLSAVLIGLLTWLQRLFRTVNCKCSHGGLLVLWSL